MAVLSVQSVVPGGLTATYASAAGGGDTMKPGDRNFLHVKNDGGASITVTVDDPLSTAPSGATEFDPDLTVGVLASGEAFIGPFPASRFRNTSDGYVHITYSGVTSVTVAALKV